MVIQMKHASTWVQFGLFLLCLLSAGWVHAETYATVSQNQVTRDSLFQLKIVTDQDVSQDDLNIDALNKDFFVNRPSFSSSVNIINGQRSSSNEWTITIAATHTGILTIPSFQIGKERTQAIAIQVTASPVSFSSQDIVEIHTHLENNILYPSESTVLHVKFIFKVDINQLRDYHITIPKGNGVTLEPMGKQDQHQEILNGQTVTILQQNYRVTAQKPGQMTITDAQFESTVFYRGEQGDTKVMRVKTPTKQIAIKVLPKPAGYQGTWLPTKSAQLKQTWLDAQGDPITDKTPLKVGDAITRTITLKIQGLAQSQLPDFNITYPNSVRVYPDKPKYQELENDTILMTLKQVLIPSQAGDITLPSITLDWWDTTQQKQRQSTLSGLNIQVASNPTVNTVVSIPQSVAPTVAPTPPKVIHRVDAGYWPYLTAGFGVLWFITLSLWFWTSRQSDTPDTPKSDTQPDAHVVETTSIKEAVQQRDGIRVQQIVQEALSGMALSEQEAHTLSETLTSLQSAFYSANPQSVDPKPLMKLLSQLKKQHQKQHRKHGKDMLAPL